MKTIRILIIDDHPVVRNGLKQILLIEKDMEVVGEAQDGITGVEMALYHEPDVILMDLVMPGMDGIEAIKHIKEALPDTRIVVLTSYHEDVMVIPAVRAGALSYLLKSTSPEELLEAIRAAVKSETRIHSRVAGVLVQDLREPGSTPDKLTPRELEILKLIAAGMSNKVISGTLFVSEKTVKTHVSNILSKLGLSDRTQAAIYALRHNMVPFHRK